MTPHGPVQRPTIRTDMVEIAVDGASPMSAYRARPATPGPFPGVIVGMELFGLSGHVRDVCEHVAGLGFVALAPDLFHRSAPGIDLPEDAVGRERGFALLHQLTREQALADIGAAFDWLRAAGSDRVGMVGLSVGGHVAYLAATVLPLAAIAVVYGGWVPTTDIPLSRPQPTLAGTAGITGRVLVLVGEHDHLIPSEHRRAIVEALRSAGIRHELVEHAGAAHGFLNPRRSTHHPAAAAEAWQRIDGLLASELH